MSRARATSTSTSTSMVRDDDGDGVGDDHDIDGDFRNECIAAVSGDASRVRDDASARASASADAGWHAPASPRVVAFPLNARETSAVVEACARRRVRVTPRGAGTGLEGGCVPYGGGCVIDTSRMKTIDVSGVERGDGVARVGAGVLKSELNAALKPLGFVFGPDPSSNPSIGGMASTGGSGLSTLKYGTSKENVRSMTVVTPSGAIIRTRAETRKSSTGYELNALYLGAEGTLGVITDLVVKVHPLPRTRCGAVVRFADVKSAAKTVADCIALNLSTLLKCELMNDEGIKVTNVVFKTSLPCEPTLFLEFVGNDERQTMADWKAFEARAEANGARGSTFAATGEELDDLFDARRGCYLGAMRYRGLEAGTLEKEHVYVGDVCVPLSRLADTISTTEAAFKRARFPCVICAHIADGNFHCLIPFKEHERAALHALEDKVIGAAIAAGGSASGEHGVGVGKQRYILQEHGATHIGIQRSIKRALDPQNIMNPGKIFPWHASPDDELHAGDDDKHRRPKLAKL